MTNYSYESARAATAAIKEKVNSLSRYLEANPPWQKDPTSGEVIYRYVIAKKIHRIIFSVVVNTSK